MVNTKDALPGHTESIALVSGIYMLELFDQDDGTVSMQVRGPVAGGWVGAGDGGPGIIARVLAANGDAAWELLRAKLREMGELRG